MPNDETELIPEEIYKKAEAEDLWFYTSYQQLWLSPNELRTGQAAGRFRWSAQNWQLREPGQRLSELIHNAEKAQQELHRFRKRLATWHEEQEAKRHA